VSVVKRSSLFSIETVKVALEAGWLACKTPANDVGGVGISKNPTIGKFEK
jgi:hypothetical protein